ncbi:hypothetical protein [Ruegeria atlantica]|uniref:hypothetical protein n=1 Tax=Ruegeria atlantica TaxID=81569 RepID=UPI00249576CE|nr:hypothetical protein [Ruegeria atlantica]
MLNRLEKFLKNEDGAVTVDWVVLTAAVVGLAAFVGIYFFAPLKAIDEANGRSMNGVATQVDSLEISVEFSGSGS